ncbi:MAG: TolC family protein [Planctomycetota bacterium]|nr:TolC family protein [Planctomycetota bacterium]
MRRSSLLILLAGLVIVGCRTAEPEDRAPDLDPYVADARLSTSSPQPEGPASLTGFESKILEIRADWEKRLGAPEELLAFYDFDSPEMRKLRKEAAADEFPASLARAVSLERVLAGAFVRNPGLLSAHKELTATIEQYAQITYLDTIMRQYVSFLRTLNTRVGPTVPMDQVQKRFPFPGTLELKAALVGHAVEAAYAKYEAALRDLVTNVRIAYADYIYLARAIANTKETLRFLEQLEATARGKLAAGTAQKAHVLQTQVEISAFENDLITLTQRRETVRARLNTLLNLPPATPLAEPAKPKMESFPAKLDPLYERALKEQPDIQLAQARADRMAAMIELAEQATYPELSAGLAYMEDISHATQGTGKDREPFSTKPKVKPDPWFGSKESYLREVREAERGARARIVASRDRTLFSVKDAYVQLDTAKRLFELYRDVQLSQARQAYSDTAAGYAADRVEFLNVIDALRRWLRFLLDSDRALRDYHQAHARLESAIGGPVERKGK